MTSKTAGPGAIAFALGILGIVVPFLPINLTNGRGLLALPFGLIGLVFAVIGRTGGWPSPGWCCACSRWPSPS